MSKFFDETMQGLLEAAAIEFIDRLNKMREVTLEERQSVQEYIDKISIPTGVNFYDLLDTLPPPCDGCPCNPKNGGSGICNCTLWTP